MSKVTLMPGSRTSLNAVMAMVRETYPDADTGIVVVFDRAGGMHTQFHCNDQEMALAGSRLLYLANAE